ncbi:MAG: hypothetical protein EHM36_11100 [Deltaproteobacteria bacterium]|nr:MAG: hypothetical protein EHM36_11100 [Deltaproteobacteria bacterium]
MRTTIPEKLSGIAADLFFNPVTPNSRDDKPTKCVVIEIEERDGELKPGYYFSPLTSKGAWEKLRETG